MTNRLLTSIVQRFSAFLARHSAQRDFEHLIERLPTIIKGKLRPDVTRQDMLTLLRALEPIEVRADATFQFSADATDVARGLGLLDEVPGSRSL